jgi:3-phenylpropionate/trans-cinnamate dioxygenase ferredoxin reductase subunit
MKQVLLEGDRRFGYDRLLVATGAVPRQLDVPGSELDGIHYLRTLDDSKRIGERIARGQRLVVVGSGWIGAEIAASARQKGCEVTMLEMASLPLERVLGPEVGQIYLDLHRAHGVEFLPETTVKRFEGDGNIERVVTEDGASIDTEFVVVGVGVAPRTGLLETAGFAVNNGVVVNQRLETSVPGVFAAGDVANVRHPFYDRHIRVEHWANALKQGPVVARAMLGKPASYDEIPYFFSDQYETGMEYGGYATEWDGVVFRGDVAAHEFVAFWLKDERLVAGMNVNVWDVNATIRELIRSRRALDPRDLADSDVPLSGLLEAGADGERPLHAEALSGWASEGGSC